MLFNDSEDHVANRKKFTLAGDCRFNETLAKHFATMNDLFIGLLLVYKIGTRQSLQKSI